MSSLYNKRWASVLRFARKLEKKLKEHSNYKVVFEGQILDNVEVVIEEDVQRFALQISPSCSYLMYYGNLGFDEGAYSTIKETKERLKREIKLVKIKEIRI